jgi:asparagine synthase (glutamine-hydrolysing)
MSGIVGLVNLDGAPVDRQLLGRMAEYMAFRGPDDQDVWLDGPVGLGHTMLRTAREALAERQPCSLDGQVWITADARVDGRADLIRDLTAKGRDVPEAASDVELVLHAYHAWDEDCTKHLIGDFAFGIWDGRRQRLFCARDHFGVKPFYYALVGNCLVFSNTLACLRIHPRVSDELNDSAIADFLLWGWNQDLGTTAFAGIQRLPAAHTLTWLEGRHRLTRYWTLPIEEPINHNRAGDYVEQFQELLRTAVDDRLRTDRVGVFMSGGLDSSTVAATASHLLSERSAPFDLRAHTVVYDRLIPDQERSYAGLVAKALGIPIQYLVGDDYQPYWRWDDPEASGPVPHHNPLVAIGLDLCKQAAAYGRVVLTGQGFDPASMFPPSHVNDLLKRWRIGRLATEIMRLTWSQRAIPRLGLRSWLMGRLDRPVQKPDYPSWLAPAFAARMNLRSRWEQGVDPQGPIHPHRPNAYRALTSPFWTNRMEMYDPEWSLVLIEVRHPFLDLRMVRYLLRLPPLPWCVNKELLRVATRGTLPEPVRLRPKAPLAGDPLFEYLRFSPPQWWAEHFDPVPDLGEYVNISAVPRVAGNEPNRLWVDLRPLSLNHWLKHVRSVNSLFKQEVFDAVT